MVLRAASNVSFNIMHASAMGSPVMDELHRQGAQRCYDCRALLGYSSYDSDNDLEDSDKRLTRVQGCSIISTVFEMCADIFAQVILTKTLHHDSQTVALPQGIHSKLAPSDVARMRKFPG